MPRQAATSDFWLRLTDARQAAGLAIDQESIAKELRLYQSAITKWKTGKGLPTLANAMRLAARSGVCVEWLLTGREPRRPVPSADPQLAKLLTFWDKLTPESAAEVVGFAVYKRSVQTTPPGRTKPRSEQPVKNR